MILLFFNGTQNVLVICVHKREYDELFKLNIGSFFFSYDYVNVSIAENTTSEDQSYALIYSSQRFCC